ncbi:MerR family transcriptional regulator [Nocardia otitidiscaviarum]|uniref:MerR family transcriptional regulator n=1 Tax=Nocardia otitidiscaviarum TaxID=1823 RepID=UPI0004A6F453|nr:MerR family transcriptional regulator [Nocardia otitidiscaviarum]MBF6136129.1 MerR family transcriptional regulator [Nocardia otitidiscaviarum]MBF6238173.1 MerR family transcriptional regulator [Nocardia otitidiscaviarum]MBF6483911.1 MerR family transcriptional regulator [Nocardia otitidiscaviarum]
MTAIVPIGEFSRLTHLSVKALRYYHDIGLLEPAVVDAHSGYRRYSTDQVERAHLIRRLRDLNMPLPEIQEVLAAPDRDTRDAALRGHLARMEAELLRTRDVVASLRALLTPSTAVAVEYRSIPSFPALAMAETVARDGIDAWCETAFTALSASLAAADLTPAGPAGATYAVEFFEQDKGEVVAFVPVAERDRESAAALGSVIDLPARRFAIAVHHGPFDDFDRTYGALGSHVAEHDTALAEPIREVYLIGPGDAAPADYRTEICWPIDRL